MKGFRFTKAFFIVMTRDIVFSLLQSNVPPPSIAYCISLWELRPFQFKVTKSRQSKVGDFTSRPNGNGRHPRITLNNDLNPYLFLITYIHEVAHFHALLQFGHGKDPHGKEWKQIFRELMDPMLTDHVFPDQILHVLRAHMINPKASSFADTKLMMALRQFDPPHMQKVVLDEVPEGSIFKLNGRYFKKGKIRRTRIICSEIKSKRHYLVPADALVSDVQLSLL